jgi:Tfp pilus assembly protein PilX
MTSALAMIYLCVIAMLSVGFYTAVDLSSNIADNEQNINRANTSSEVGLAYGRFQLSQPTALISVPPNANSILSAFTFNLTGASYSPSTQPSGAVAIGTSSSPITVDSLGGKVYVTAAVNGNQIQLDSYGKNANSRVTAIQRHTRLQFTPTYNPLFNYGLVSYGQISLNGGLTITGTNGGVLAVTTGATKPINVNGANSFSGDFYWTNTNYTRTSITWGSLEVATAANPPNGYISTNVNFASHVHSGVTPPTKPTFDSSGFQQFVATSYTNTTYSPTTTLLTNTELKLGTGQTSATFTFSNPLTINGILYIDAGVTVKFTNAATGVSINGAIVQQNAASGANSGAVTFSGPVTQSDSNLSTVGLTINEQNLLTLGSYALLLPNNSITFNNTVSTAGSIIGNGLIFNKNVTVAGAIVNMSSSSMIFNSTATLNINTASPVQPAGVNTTYSPTANSYSEVYP